jgi:hypothetical protein
MGVDQCISGADWGAGLFASESRSAHLKVLPKLNSGSRARALILAHGLKLWQKLPTFENLTQRRQLLRNHINVSSIF